MVELLPLTPLNILIFMNKTKKRAAKRAQRRLSVMSSFRWTKSLSDGMKIPYIKAYREHYNCGLAEAHRAFLNAQDAWLNNDQLSIDF